jgi:hypothetical protein
MMEGRSYLDQCLKKTLLRLLQLEPKALPMFMGFEELLASITVETRRERSGLPFKRHPSSIGDAADRFVSFCVRQQEP